MSRQIGEVPTSFPPGEIIREERSQGRGLIVHIGRVERADRRRGQTVARAAQGDLLGELGLPGNTPRSAWLWRPMRSR
jgi:CRP-like cAMP-binding protein